MKFSISPFTRFIFVLILSSLLHVQGLSAQHTWQHTEICEDCIPKRSFFRDSSMGYVHVGGESLLFNDRHFLTTDGGDSWRELDSLVSYRLTKQIYHDIDINSDGDLYFIYSTGSPRLSMIYDRGIVRQSADLWYLPAEFDMLDSLEGRMIGQSKFTGGTNFSTTFNGGLTWHSIYDDRYVDGYDLVDARLIDKGAIVSYKLKDTLIFECTLDSARTWSSDTIYLSQANYQVGPLSLGSAYDRYFQVVQGKDALDYIATADGGKTWTQHNIADGRVHRIYEPAPNKLWAIVARTIGPLLPYIPHNIEVDPKYMSDTLYYSTNAGATWEKDLTFANDTIADMHWPDAEHGFVVSYGDNKVKVSRLAGLMEVNKQIEVKRLEVWPNPSKDRVFTFTAPETGEYSLVVTDIAGRTVQSNEIFLSSSKVHTITLDSKLPAGAYIVSLNSEEASATAKLLLK